MCKIDLESARILVEDTKEDMFNLLIGFFTDYGLAIELKGMAKMQLSEIGMMSDDDISSYLTGFMKKFPKIFLGPDDAEKVEKTMSYVGVLHHVESDPLERTALEIVLKALIKLLPADKCARYEVKKKGQ